MYFLKQEDNRHRESWEDKIEDAVLSAGTKSNIYLLESDKYILKCSLIYLDILNHDKKCNYDMFKQRTLEIPGNEMNRRCYKILIEKGIVTIKKNSVTVSN